MLILFISLAIAGLAMVFLGVKWMRKSKTITTLPFTNSAQKFTVPHPGMYGVCIMGGSDVKNTGSFGAQMKDMGSGKQITLLSHAVKTQVRKNKRPGVEYFQFNAANAGTYSLKLENPEQLTVKKSGLKTVRALQSAVPNSSLEILIKETIPQNKLLISILLIVLGGNLALWGGVLIAKPQLVGGDNTVHLILK